MAYSQRFVVSILVNGKVQKELGDNTVELPFGSEYALRFRNKHRSQRAVVRLYIDGEEQSKSGYVLQPNGFVDIERNSYSPTKFLFVAPDSADAQDFGKDPDNKERLNGVIEARFYLEKEQPVVKEVHHHHHDHWRDRPPWRRRRDDWVYPCFGDATLGGPVKGSRTDDTTEFGFSNSNEPKMECCSDNADMGKISLNEAAPQALRMVRSRAKKREVTAGVTVEGSHSSQTFRKVEVDLEEQFTAIKVYLKGYQDEERVEEVASANPSESSGYCPNCGAKRKPPQANFCHVCAHKY